MFFIGKDPMLMFFGAPWDWRQPRQCFICFSLNILLRVFSIPGGECVSIVLAGLAFSRPPPCNTRGGFYYLFFSLLFPRLFKLHRGVLGETRFQVHKLFFTRKRMSKRLLAKECQIVSCCSPSFKSFSSLWRIPILGTQTFFVVVPPL